MNWEEILIYVIEAVCGIVVAIVIPFIVKIVKNKVGNDTCNSYIDWVQNLITQCVTMVQQTYVNGLKAEGKFDEKAQKKAFNTCVSSVKGLLSNEAQNVITKIYGDLDSYLKTQIEASVLNLKNQSN